MSVMYFDQRCGSKAGDAGDVDEMTNKFAHVT